MEENEEVVEGADTGAAGGEADAGTGGGAVPADWDGTIESLRDQPWVPEAARPHIEKHLGEWTETRTRTDFLNRMFEADDKTAELTKALTERETELASLKKALEDAGKERDTFKGKVESYEAERQQEASNREYERIKTTYPDIHADCRPDPKDPENFEGAWPLFLDLVGKGYSEEQAAKMARATIEAPAPAGPSGGEAALGAAPAAQPPPPAKREVKVPPSVAAASRGGNNPAATVNAAEANENFEARARRLAREAEERGE